MGSDDKKFQINKSVFQGLDASVENQQPFLGNNPILESQYDYIKKEDDAL